MIDERKAAQMASVLMALIGMVANCMVEDADNIDGWTKAHTYLIKCAELVAKIQKIDKKR